MTATSKRWWPRSVARVGRLIGRLYRWRLGWLFGHRFALLTHEGRRSGKTYRTALWVYRYQPGTGQVRGEQAGHKPLRVAAAAQRVGVEVLGRCLVAADPADV